MADLITILLILSLIKTSDFNYYLPSLLLDADSLLIL